MQDFSNLIGLLHRLHQALTVIALNHTAQNLQLMDMLSQHVQDVVFILQEYRCPRLRKTLCQTHRTLKTSARKVEDMLLLALLLLHRECQRKRCNMRDVRDVGAVHILLLGRHIFYGHTQRMVDMLHLLGGVIVR